MNPQDWNKRRSAYRAQHKAVSNPQDGRLRHRDRRWLDRHSARLERTDSPLKGEVWGVAWDNGKDYGLAGAGERFHAFGDTPEEAIKNAREVVGE